MDVKGAEDGVKVPGPVMAPKTHWSPWEAASASLALRKEVSREWAAHLGKSQDGDEGSACK